MNELAIRWARDMLGRHGADYDAVTEETVALVDQGTADWHAADARAYHHEALEATGGDVPEAADLLRAWAWHARWPRLDCGRTDCGFDHDDD